MKKLLSLLGVLQMATVVWWIGAGVVSARGADSAVILQYHRFGEANLPSTNVTIDQLEAHIEHLVRGDYAVLPVTEILSKLRTGQELPDRTIGITVDDAALSVLEEALPRFRKAGFPFTLFVSTDAIDQSHGGTMSWEHLRRLVATGVTIGNHGSAHNQMWRNSDRTNREDVLNANRRIKEELGVDPVLFAYPYGEWNGALRELVSTLGFVAGFGQQSGVVNVGSDFFNLPRYPLNEKYGDIGRFKFVVDTLAIPVKDINPVEPVLIENPPSVGFTPQLPESVLRRINCYASNGVGALLRHLPNRRVEIRFDKMFPEGRTRLNCTAQHTTGRWHWFGMQFVVP